MFSNILGLDKILWTSNPIPGRLDLGRSGCTCLTILRLPVDLSTLLHKFNDVSERLYVYPASFIHKITTSIMWGGDDGSGGSRCHTIPNEQLNRTAFSRVRLLIGLVGGNIEKAYLHTCCLHAIVQTFLLTAALRTHFSLTPPTASCIARLLQHSPLAAHSSACCSVTRFLPNAFQRSSIAAKFFRVCSTPSLVCCFYFPCSC